MKRLCLLCLFIVSIVASPELINKAKEVEKTFSLKDLEAVQKELRQWMDKNPQDDNAHYWFARVCLANCNVQRFFRRELSDKQGKNITRPGTAKVAEKGIVVLDKLLKKRANWSELYRVRGELHSHTIVGFLTGMSKGPQALEDLNRSIEIDKNNSLAHIANAKMFYYNPPIAGGDVDRGIATCKKAVKLGGDDKAYTLLGRCYIKKGRPKRAELYLRKALKINPKNLEAQHFLNIALQK
ncbi:tetratricopeptide repeat protein [Candidatus Uabimicrobium amorphum]|uniref:Tetratricopeptide repeat protein n=1 Tax=Uabimicrobium amorphum TaxID=2596890 RepID=A0A5S9F6H7_UABAM|nr:tetratricopeptide repeat protein [Candidatus Uabimicrobium amorphum]BBM87213.1 hypothetical protein UABAM_05616 [Candidatus Uabimicrobium amorphum]